jgi:hypothetical protein
MGRVLRFLTLTILAVSVPVMTVAIPGSAYARDSAAKRVKIVKVKMSCAKLTGNATGTPHPPMLLNCTTNTEAPGAGSTATFSTNTFPTAATSGGNIIMWGRGVSTSFVYTSTIPQSKGNRCPAGWTEEILHGHVTANLLPPSGQSVPIVKGALHADVCFDSNRDLSLLNGSPYRI